MKKTELIGPDGRRCIVNYRSTEFWDFLASYCEDSPTVQRAIPGLRLRWAVGLFAVDAHVGGISRAQFGRAVGRHPGHAGREIDGGSPSQSARQLFAQNFRSEITYDGVDEDGIDQAGDWGDSD